MSGCLTVKSCFFKSLQQLFLLAGSLLVLSQFFQKPAAAVSAGWQSGNYESDFSESCGRYSAIWQSFSYESDFLMPAAAVLQAGQAEAKSVLCQALPANSS